MAVAKRKRSDFPYDVCLAFAEENEAYVQEVAQRLENEGIRVLSDKYVPSQNWGRDFLAHLTEIYQHKAFYSVIFASRYYAEKAWLNSEGWHAQVDAVSGYSDYILPARFDDTRIPGFPDTVIYIQLQWTTADELANLIKQKLGEPLGPGAEATPPLSIPRRNLAVNPKGYSTHPSRHLKVSPCRNILGSRLSGSS